MNGVVSSAVKPTKQLLAGVRVLVVEDRADHLGLTLRVLTDAGAQAKGFTTGQEGFDAVHEGAPDVLIVDLGLPDVSAVTLVRRIRKLPGTANMAIVAFTAESSHEKRDEAIKNGVEYYVVKPDFARLIHVVGHAASK
jgi:CheY-like chemotaxis protein